MIKQPSRALLSVWILQIKDTDAPHPSVPACGSAHPVSCCMFPVPTVTLHILRCFQSLSPALTYAIATTARLIASMYDGVTAVLDKEAKSSRARRCTAMTSCRAGQATCCSYSNHSKSRQSQGSEGSAGAPRLGQEAVSWHGGVCPRVG